MKFVRGKARLPMAFVFAILMCVVCGGNAVFAESILGSPRITSLDDEYYGTIGENEITDGDSITLKWSSVTNATGYNWYIKQLRGTPDPTNNNESAVNSWTGSTGTSSTSRKHTLRGSNVSAGYWYKFVVEATASGYTSGWSDWVYVYVDEATLGDVVISGLTDEYAGTVGSNGITAGSGITFRWSASENATQYTWYIKQLSGTPDPTDDNEPYVSGGYWHGTTGTSSSSRTCTLKGDDVVAGYWYKFVVKASASGYMDRWSNWVYCYVAPGSLAKAKVVSPSAWDELTAGSSILFDWDPVPGAKKYHYYIKQLSGEPDTSNDNEPCVASWDAEVGSSTTKYTLSGTNVKSGYWYKFVVSAISNAQNVSWSEWRYVYIQENAPLDRPKITSPLSGESYDAGNDIVFTWDKVSGAASYAYYIKQLEGEPDFSDNEKAVNSWSGTTKASVRRYVLDGNHIQPNTWYKFVVEARADGCVSGWSYYTYIKIPKNENWIEVTAPKSLQNVESEAYNGNKRLRVYDASQSSLVSIDGKAFYNCTNLIAVKLPATVASIASDAFSGCSNLTIYCPAGSEAERFAKAHGIRTEIYGIVVEKDLLTLSANNWVIGSENAANKVVSVSSTGTWKAVSSKSWLTVSAASGINGESVVLTASENTGSSERNAKVTFTSGSATAVVSVNQSGAQSSVVTPVVAGSWTDPSTITVTLGDQYRLNGSVSVSNGKLGVVSVSVANGSNQALTNNYDGMVSGISLASESAFVIDTAKDSDFAKAGTYSLALYAKAYGSNNAVKIGEKTLVVKSPVVEKAPVVSASLTTNKVNNSGSGKLGVTVTTTYADRFYIEVLNGSTPISISDQWKGTVKKREYNGDDFALPTLYTATSKSWGPVYFTIPQGTVAGDYTVRVTALNDENGKSSNSVMTVSVTVRGSNENDKTDFSNEIWSVLTKQWGLSAMHAAAVMGNIEAESSYSPYNSQSHVGLDDRTKYEFKTDDGIGFGLCQWTASSRKLGLLNYAKSKGNADLVWDFDTQMEYLKSELNLTKLQSFTSLYEATEWFVLWFEKPSQAYSNSWPGTRYAKALYAYKKQMGKDYSEPAVSFSVKRNGVDVTSACKLTDNMAVSSTASIVVKSNYYWRLSQENSTVNGWLTITCPKLYYPSQTVNCECGYAGETTLTLKVNKVPAVGQSYSTTLVFELYQNNRIIKKVPITLAYTNVGGQQPSDSVSTYRQAIVKHAKEWLNTKFSAYGVPYYVHGVNSKTVTQNSLYYHGLPYVGGGKWAKADGSAADSSTTY